MIQKGSTVKINDNTGIKEIKCIHLYHGFFRRYSKIGDVILGSVKKINLKKKNIKFKKGQMVNALLIQTKYSNQTKNFGIFFRENSGTIISKQKKLLATRIFGPIQNIFRKTRFLKLISLAKGIIK